MSNHRDNYNYWSFGIYKAVWHIQFFPAIFFEKENVKVKLSINSYPQKCILAAIFVDQRSMKESNGIIKPKNFLVTYKENLCYPDVERIDDVDKEYDVAGRRKKDNDNNSQKAFAPFYFAPTAKLTETSW